MPPTMTASDVMSTPLIFVEPSTPVAEIAAVMRDHHIGGVPVLNGGRLQGIVTEGDLIERHEIGTDQLSYARPWWRRLRRSDAQALAYVRSHGRLARHVMSAPVHAVEPSASLASVARVFRSHRVGRVPVVSGAEVVGIIAQADLVRALASRPAAAAPATARDDEAIRNMLVSELSAQEWWNGCWENVYVNDGVITFKGVVENEVYRLAAKVAAENIPGVRGVVDDRILSTHVTELL